MEKILVLVEGQTEETFVRDVLAPHLLHFDKVLITTLLVTKRVKSGSNFKGGVTSYHQVKRDLQRLLGDSSARKVTTMLDYYALPADFPGADTGTSSVGRLAGLERAFAADMSDARLIPYLSEHEFEALLFVDPASAGWLYGSQTVVKQLEEVRGMFGGRPEAIDQGPSTAPSRRVEAAFPRYQKPLHGPLAAQAAGLPVLRSSCPHFDGWVTALER